MKGNTDFIEKTVRCVGKQAVKIFSLFLVFSDLRLKQAICIYIFFFPRTALWERNCVGITTSNNCADHYIYDYCLCVIFHAGYVNDVNDAIVQLLVNYFPFVLIPLLLRNDQFNRNERKTIIFLQLKVSNMILLFYIAALVNTIKIPICSICEWTILWSHAVCSY